MGGGTVREETGIAQEARALRRSIIGQEGGHDEDLGNRGYSDSCSTFLDRHFEGRLAQPGSVQSRAVAFPTKSGQFAYVHWTANCRSNSTGLTCPSVEWRRDGL